MDQELQRITDKYSGVKLCDMSSTELEEFLGGIAKRASADTLKALGLNDDYAVADIRDLRDLLKGFRVIKKTAVTTTLAALGRILGWIIVLSLAGLFLHSEASKKLVDLLVK